jgi:hypothetical protein
VGAVVAGLIVLCSFLTIIAFVFPAEETAPDPTVTTTDTVDPSPAPTRGSAEVTPRPVTMEDGLYHVGEDVPAGTYRMREAVTDDDWCYWRKSKDAEGSDIIDNDLAGSGRLQVTLKAGQWFETQRCGTWVRK